MALIPMRRFMVRALCQLGSLRQPPSYNHGYKAALPAKGSVFYQRLTEYMAASCFHTGNQWLSKPTKKGVPFVPVKERQITLIDENESATTVTKAQGDRIARNKELKLRLIDESSEPHPTYKLMTGLELQQERVRLRDLKKANKKKELKSVRLTSKITSHDLETKTSHITDWLEKGHEVKISIKINKNIDSKGAQDVFKFVAGRTKEIANVNQAKSSETELVYHLRPTAEDSLKENQTPTLFKNEELKAMKTSPEQT